jgi:hypothetical protein
VTLVAARPAWRYIAREKMHSGVILGDWTHRRGDPGGTRHVTADVARARPRVAWTWRPDHGGPVDQIRTAGACLYVATMRPREDEAPGWEHAVIYALEAETGRVIARRALPDPVPVAALVVEGGVVHVIATRKGEPIFWYALQAVDLVPRHRRLVLLDRDARHEDVLDAWASPDGGLWLELEGALGGTRGRAYAFAPEGDGIAVAQTHEEDLAGPEWGAPARDACSDGHTLFAPLGTASAGAQPAVWRVEPKMVAPDAAAGGVLEPPAKGAWARAELAGENARVHAMSAEGVVSFVAAAQDPDRPDRALVQAMGVDKSSDVTRWKTNVERVPLRAPLGDRARIARRQNGELLFQSMRVDGTPSSDLVCARSDGRLGSIVLGAGNKFLLDAALGDLVLAHHEAKTGRVTVGGFEIDREGRLLGRRSVVKWTVDTEDLGGSTTVYAGAGQILVRGARGLAALRA